MSTFSPSGSSQVSISGGLAPVSTPTIVNFTLVNLGQEYSLSVPPGTKRFYLRSRVNREIRVAYAANGTNTAWLTIPIGTTYSEVDLAVTSLTLYMQSTSSANNHLEVIFWA